MFFENVDFGLVLESVYNDDLEKFTITNSFCPWKWEAKTTNNMLYYTPDEGSSSDSYWNFNFTLQLTAISACSVTAFKINDIDVISKITDETQTDYYKNLAFSLPIKSIIENSKNINLNKIPITFDISFSQGSETARLYNNESSSAPMYLNLDGENHKLSFSTFQLVESYNSGGSFAYHSLHAASYDNTEANEFVTFPTKTIKNFKFQQSDSTNFFFTFDSIVPISNNYITYGLPIGINNKFNCIVKEVNNTTVTCQIIVSNLSGVQELVQQTYLTNSAILDLVTLYHFNATPSDKNQLQFYKTGQIEAVEFIESDNNQILLQKGGRIWCKEFIEWDTAVLPSKNEFYRFHDEDLTYNGSVEYDLQSFFGNIPTGTQISNTWILPSGLVSFKNNCILNWYSKTDETTYNGYNIQLVLFNIDTTHRTYIDLSTTTIFDNIISDITATETEYATHAYLQLINNNTGITEDQVNSFNNVLEIYYQEGSHVDINNINYNKNYSIICKELKEV